MGRSANRLSKTRSGVVSARLLGPGMICFPLSAPIPPLALLGWESRILRLGYGGAKDVQAANVLRLPGDLTQFFVQLLRIAPRKLRHPVNAQHIEVADHRRPHRNQVLQTTLSCSH